MPDIRIRWVALTLALAALTMAGGTSADIPGDPPTLAPVSDPYLQVTPSSILMFAQISDTVTIPPSVALNVANLGGGTMSWTADASPNWINITPTIASTPGPLTVTLSDVSLMTTSTATYHGAITVSATTSGTANTPQVIPITFKVITTVYQTRLLLIFHNYTAPPPLGPITPTDPYYGSQWGLAKIQADMAWNFSTGSPSVTIAVLDTGVDTTHPDLASQLVPGHNLANGSDDDNYQDDCGSDTGHGTHVAGIAAAATNNGIGVAGLGWETKIMPVKVLGGNLCEGSYADIIRGIDWATSHGAQVINLSLGGSYNSVLDSATTNAFMSGTLVVAAAGNCGTWQSGCDSLNQVFSPAGNAHVLGVAATDSSDVRASFSTANATVDIAAPGVSIYSTWPGAYRNLSGTSMATPFVSGLASLVYARFPAYTPTQVAQAIVANADLVGGNTGWSPEYGCGRINAYRTLANGASGVCAGWSGLSIGGWPDASPPMVAGRDYVPGQVLVILRDADPRQEKGGNTLQAQAMANRYGFAMSDLVPRWRTYRLYVPVGQEQVALDALRVDPSVEAASLNGIVRVR